MSLPGKTFKDQKKQKEQRGQKEPRRQERGGMKNLKRAWEEEQAEDLTKALEELLDLEELR